VNVLLVPAHPGFPGQIPQSRKTVVVVVVLFINSFYFSHFLFYILLYILLPLSFKDVLIAVVQICSVIGIEYWGRIFESS